MVNKRLKFLLIILIISLVIFIINYFSLPKVIIDNNKIIKSNYDFIHEHWKEIKLKKLFQNEKFKDIKADSQFGLFIKFCDWTHNQWKHGIPDPYPLCNAIDILSDIRNAKTGGHCGQYSYVLADVLKSMGFYNVRYVEISNTKGEGHFVVEVWSDEYNKWIILDADQNIYFILINSSIPANAYEIRNSLYKGDKVNAVSIDKKSEVNTKVAIQSYANFAVSLRSDLMRHTMLLTLKDRYDMFLFYKDKYTNKPYEKGIPYKNVTSRINDIYFDCNKIRVEYIRSFNYITFKFYTDSSVPNFKEILMKTKSSRKWENIAASIKVYKSQNLNEFLVAPVNQLNRIGVVQKIRINW